MNRQEHPERHAIRLMIERGEEDDPEQIAIREITVCPQCRGRCEDKYGAPCGTCFGEGEI